MKNRRRTAHLDLRDLGTGAMIGLSPQVGGALAQAGAVCLESEQHVPGVDLVVTGEASGVHLLEWAPPDDQARRTWRNEIDATENGAAGIGIVLARRLLGYAVTSRSRHGTGFDYWLGQDKDENPIEDEVRLEVSGIRHGSAGDVARRLRQKLGQMKKGAVAAAGFAIVVEFGCPKAKIGKA